MWGLTPGRANISNWERMRSGDYILFYLGVKEGFNYPSRIKSKIRSKFLTEILWGEDGTGQTWELIYFLEKPSVLSQSEAWTLDEYLKECGYKGQPQGFMRVANEDCAKRIIMEFFRGVVMEQSINKNSDSPDEISRLFDKISELLQEKGQIILYGPPGTGKTWLAVEYTKEKAQKRNNYEFVTFHQSYSYEEFIEGFRPESESGNITYRVKDGIFKKLAVYATWEALKQKEGIRENVELEKERKLSFDEALKKFKELYSKGGELVTLSGRPFKIIRCSDTSIKIKPLGGSKEHSITLEHLRKLWGENIERVIDVTRILGDIGRGSYYYAIYRKLKEMAQETERPDEEERYNQIKEIVMDALRNKILTKQDFENVANFYLVIDEINRGNISKIFGELITLLEMDKRLGAENEIIITLPYSGEPFAVPPSLYMIGTMNSSDRSIALLDVALRRRFSFLEIVPNPRTLKGKEISSINLEKLLEELNVRIEALKDRDHRIGHSYFLKVRTIEDLQRVWYNEVIPLLMEYFYNDWDSLSMIIPAFVQRATPFNGESIYRIKKLEGEEFINALLEMLSSEESEGV